MVICPDCGKDVPESKFCKNCGAYIKDVESPAEQNGKFGFCSKCGNELDGDYSFCPECGEDISTDNEVDAIEEAIESDDAEEVIPVEDVEADSSVESGDVGEGELIEETEDDEDIESGDADNADSEEVEETTHEESEDEVSAESEDVEEVIPDEEEETESLLVSVQSSDKVSFCFNCGYKLVGDYKFCPECGQDLSGKTMGNNAQTANSHSGEKNTLLAVILSLFLPGLGQIYLGLDHKGAIFLIAYVVSAILILILIGFLLCFVIWIWALVDTIISANALNRGDEVKDKLL